MNDPTFEAALRKQLQSAAPARVPAGLEARIRRIPETASIRPPWWQRLGTRPTFVAATVAGVLLVALSVETVLRPAPDSGGRGNQVSIQEPFGTFVASDIALAIDGRRIRVPGPGDPGIVRATFAGYPTFGQLTLVWRDDGQPYVLLLHVAADARTWWLTDALVSDGRSEEGGWIYFQGPLLETPRGERFSGSPVLQSVRSTHGEVASLRFGHLELAAFTGVAARDPVAGPMPPTGQIAPDGPDFIPMADQGLRYVSSRWRDDVPIVSFRGQGPDVPVFGPDLKTIVAWVGGGPGAGPAPSAAPSAAPRADLEFAVSELFRDRCVSPEQAEQQIEALLANLGYGAWKFEHGTGAGTSECVAVALSVETRTVTLLMNLAPEVHEGLAVVREQLYNECRTREEATALVDAVLRKAGMTGYRIEPGSLSVPSNRAPEVQRHVANGCWVYSTLGWTSDGTRMFWIAGN